MARAMGGAVVHDLSSAEVGTHSVRLTDEGHADPVFGPLGDEFPAQMGHEDRVAELPPGATLLATSPRNRNQAYRFDGLPIYCTQFHPELTRTDLFERVRVYPQYVENIEGITIEEFCSRIRESAETEQLLRRFINYVF
jgi:GMP synthase (glutamine-hydrolysing)